MWTSLITINPPTTSTNTNISVLSVDPWTQGISSGSGSNTVLPFPNAVQAIIAQLNEFANAAALGIAVSTTNLTDFSRALAGFSSVFPLPLFERLQRRADKVQQLESTKFQLVAPQQPAQNLSLNTLPALRETYRQQLIAESKQRSLEFKNSNPLTNLSAFVSAKTARAETQTTTPPVNGLIAGSAWRFYADTDLSTALTIGHPSYEYALTTVLLFIAPANDLTTLRAIFP